VTIFTIGYEGKTLSQYIRLLQKNTVTLVVDVRQNPVSRKKGFSKRQLGEALRQAGIEYCHLVELGNPKEIRAEFYKNGSATMLYDQYKQHLSEHPEAVQLLLDTIENHSACLTCYEGYPIHCHRGAITEFLRERYSDIKVVHL